LNKTLTRLLARHLRMELREDLVPDQDDLADEPKVQPIATVTDQHLKWLHGLAHQAHDRYRQAMIDQADPENDEWICVRPIASLVNALMMLFERGVRERFHIADAANIVVTRDWMVYGYAAKPSCGSGEQQDCDGNCEDCDKDDGHDCGPDCISNGGPGCGRPDCTCEEPPDLKRLTFTITVEEAPSLMSLGTVFMRLFAMCRNEEPDDGTHKLPLNITENGYKSMKTMCRLLQQICTECEESEGWCTEDEPDEE